MAEGISARLTPKQGRAFAFPVGGAFAVLAAIAFLRHHPTSWRVLGTLSASLLVAGAIIPTWLGPVERAWMGFAHALSRVTTPIVMGIIYFLLLTPMALVMRAFGRNAMRNAERSGSFWVEPPSGGRSDLTHQF